MRDEYKLKVFENRTLRKIFGPKRKEVTGKWRKLHKEVLYSPYCSPNIIDFLWRCGPTRAMASPF
jgi:hypothetical protein